MILLPPGFLTVLAVDWTRKARRRNAEKTRSIPGRTGYPNAYEWGLRIEPGGAAWLGSGAGGEEEKARLRGELTPRSGADSDATCTLTADAVGYVLG